MATCEETTQNDLRGLFPEAYHTLDQCMAGDAPWIAARVVVWLVIFIGYAIFALDCANTIRRMGWRSTWDTTGLLMVVFVFCGTHRLLGALEIMLPTQRLDTLVEGALAVVVVAWTLLRLGKLPQFVTSATLEQHRAQRDAELLHRERIDAKLAGETARADRAEAQILAMMHPLKNGPDS